MELVGVERELPALDGSLAADPNLHGVAADLREPLPFSEASFEAAVCHNTLECLPDKQALLREVARVLGPGGQLLLGHSDFDTMVFNAPDIELTRRLVHANADTQEKWMDASDGTIGRKLVAVARRSPFELCETFAWVTLDTDFEPDPAAPPELVTGERSHGDDRTRSPTQGVGARRSSRRRNVERAAAANHPRSAGQLCETPRPTCHHESRRRRSSPWGGVRVSHGALGRWAR